MITWQYCSYVFTDGTCDILSNYLFDNMAGLSCVFTDGTCDCVKVIFIWQHEGNVAVCLLTVCVTVVR